jgi:hypothetical protein
MGARVDQTRNKYFIHDIEESEERDTGATVGSFPEDWPDDDEEWLLLDDDIAS